MPATATAVAAGFEPLKTRDRERDDREDGDHHQRVAVAVGGLLFELDLAALRRELEGRHQLRREEHDRGDEHRERQQPGHQAELGRAELGASASGSFRRLDGAARLRLASPQVPPLDLALGGGPAQALRQHAFALRPRPAALERLATTGRRAGRSGSGRARRSRRERGAGRSARGSIRPQAISTAASGDLQPKAGEQGGARALIGDGGLALVEPLRARRSPRLIASTAIPIGSSQMASRRRCVDGAERRPSTASAASTSITQPWASCVGALETSGGGATAPTSPT